MKKALIITGNLVQDHEFIYPYYRLQEAGYEVDVATKNGEDIKGIIGMKIEATDHLSAIGVEEEAFGYDLLILPGGAKCLEKLRQENEVLLFIKDFNKKGKVIGSICHGTQLLISAGVVKGRKISGYYSIRDDITNAGAEYVDAPFVTDKNIVSSPHYKHLGPWMKEVLRLANGRNK